jgi:hypothetical protein
MLTNKEKYSPLTQVLGRFLSSAVAYLILVGKGKKKNKPVNSSTESVYSHITDSSVVDYFSDSNYLQIYAKRVVLVLSNRAFRILLRIVFGAQKLQATRIYLHIPSACSCSSAASLNRLACTIILR